MRRAAVTSSNLASVGYHSLTRTLEIEFRSGGVYQYFNVPETVWRELIAAPSKGRYFHQNIRERYRYEQVG